jgi:glucose-6-phosphate isomerase
VQSQYRQIEIWRVYSTPFEFNNSINSRQSLFSGIGVAAVAEFDQDIQALLNGHRRVLARVGVIGVPEAGKYLTAFSTVPL